jgi:hypothetical protein
MLRMTDDGGACLSLPCWRHRSSNMQLLASVAPGESQTEVSRIGLWRREASFSLMGHRVWSRQWMDQVMRWNGVHLPCRRRRLSLAWCSRASVTDVVWWFQAGPDNIGGRPGKDQCLDPYWRWVCGRWWRRLFEHARLCIQVLLDWILLPTRCWVFWCGLRYSDDMCWWGPGMRPRQGHPLLRTCTCYDIYH